MRISLINVQQLIGQSLKAMLLHHPEFHQVDLYDGVAPFLEALAHKEYPDVLITDIALPETNGIELLAHLRTKHPEAPIKVIFLSSVVDVHAIRRAIKAGAQGFLSNNISEAEFKKAILEVMSGGQYIAEHLRAGLMQHVFLEEEVAHNLSPRELEVLRRVCRGQTIKEIAFDLSLSYHTVQYYHRSVMVKLNVKRIQELVVYAIQHGLYIPEIESGSSSS